MPLDIYSNRIRRILYNCYKYAPKMYAASIDKVKNWLECEWYLGRIDSTTYFYLCDNGVDEIAKEIISEIESE